jgi:hypothetical protein
VLKYLLSISQKINIFVTEVRWLCFVGEQLFVFILETRRTIRLLCGCLQRNVLQSFNCYGGCLKVSDDGPLCLNPEVERTLETQFYNVYTVRKVEENSLVVMI